MNFQYDDPNKETDEQPQPTKEELKPQNTPEVEESESEDEEDEEENEKLRILILRYKSSSRFSAFLKECKIKFDGIEDMNNAQLNILLNKIKINLNNKTSGNITNSLIIAGIEKGEMLLTTMNICDLSGLSEELKSNDVFLDSLEEVIIESNLSFQFKDPKKKLAYELFKTAYMVNTMNKLKKHNPQLLNTVINTPNNTPIESNDLYKADE
jgi:hypothetical protein